MKDKRKINRLVLNIGMKSCTHKHCCKHNCCEIDGKTICYIRNSIEGMNEMIFYKDILSKLKEPLKERKHLNLLQTVMTSVNDREYSNKW